MSYIVLTLADGETAVTGKQLTFIAPCNCDVPEGIRIGSSVYTVVDAAGNSILGKDIFVSGSLVTVTLDVENLKAYVQNASVQAQIDALGKSVADGKELLATTISNAGYATVASDATFAQINTGISTSISKAKAYRNFPNGTEWSHVYPDVPMTSIAFGQGIFVGCGTSGGVYISNDGVSWTSTHSAGGTNLSSYSFSDIEYKGGAFCVYTTASASAYCAAQAYYSVDGINWTPIVSKLVNGLIMIDCVLAYYNSSGITAHVGTVLSKATNRVAYSPASGLYVAATVTGLYYSYGGLSWTLITGSTGSWIDVVWVNHLQRFYALSSTGALMYQSASNITSNWTSVTIGVSGAQALYYVDEQSTLFAAGSAGIWKSTNGTTFSKVLTKYIMNICYADGIFVAMAQDGGTASFMYYSTNGTSWKAATVATDNPLSNLYTRRNSIVHGAGRWVMATSGGTSYSTTWAP